jgi:hypothetical protein
MMAKRRIPFLIGLNKRQIHPHGLETKTGGEVHEGAQNFGVGAGWAEMNLKVYGIRDPIAIPIYEDIFRFELSTIQSV